jgi:hypothetical protein
MGVSLEISLLVANNAFPRQREDSKMGKIRDSRGYKRNLLRFSKGFLWRVVLRKSKWGNQFFLLLPLIALTMLFSPPIVFYAEAGTLYITVDGIGGVQSDPPGIYCCNPPVSPCSDCSEIYVTSTDVHLNAIPGNSCWQFLSWYDGEEYVISNPITVSMGLLDTTFRANFGLIAYTISGRVIVQGSVTGLDGVYMSGFPSGIYTDSNGDYTATVNCGWTGNVYPIKAGYSFSPTSLAYSNIQTDHTAEDYEGTLTSQTYSLTVNKSGDGAGYIGRLESVTV